MKILITDGRGFIQLSSADALHTTTDAEIVLVDNFLTGKKD